MAWRQPFRSGLKDLAEGLIRQSNALKHNTEIQMRIMEQENLIRMQEQQQLGQIAAQQWSQMGQLAAQTAQQVLTPAKPDFEALRERGGEIVKYAQGELTKAKENYATLLASGADPAELSRMRAVIADYETLVGTSDLTQVPSMYEAIRNTPYGQIKDRVSARERAAGRAPQVIVPGARPSDVLAQGAAASAMAGRMMGAQVGSAEDIQQIVSEFDPSKPATVWAAENALRNLQLLPPELRAVLAPALTNLLTEFRNNKEQVDVFNSAVSAITAGNDLTVKNLEIAGQTYDLNALRITEEQWAKNRREIEAKQKDTLFVEDIATNIATAAANNDPHLLQFYLNAWQQENSPLGTVLRTMFEGEAGFAKLQELYDGAKARFDVEVGMLNSDATLRDAQARTAVQTMRQAEALTPLETEALRAKYRVDLAQANVDLATMPLNTKVQVAETFDALAKVVPPEFWDNPSPLLVAKAKEHLLDLSVYRRRSEMEEWTRADPIRQEAWQMFETLFEAPPVDAWSQQAMLQAASAYIDRMGVGGIEKTGLMNSLLSVWALTEEDRAAARAAAAGSADEMGVTELNTLANIWARLSNTMDESARRFVSEASLYGCAIVSQSPYLMPMVVSWEPGDKLRNDGNGTCGDMQSEYTQLQQNVVQFNEWQEYFARLASGAVTPAGGAPPSYSPTNPPTLPSAQPGAVPSAPGPQPNPSAPAPVFPPRTGGTTTPTSGGAAASTAGATTSGATAAGAQGWSFPPGGATAQAIPQDLAAKLDDIIWRSTAGNPDRAGLSQAEIDALDAELDREINALIAQYGEAEVEAMFRARSTATLEERKQRVRP